MRFCHCFSLHSHPNCFAQLVTHEKLVSQQQQTEPARTTVTQDPAVPPCATHRGSASHWVYGSLPLQPAANDDVFHSCSLSDSQLHSGASFERYTQSSPQTGINFIKEGSYKRRTNLAACRIHSTREELHPTCTVRSPSSTEQALV